jgi:hypothetical protein
MKRRRLWVAMSIYAALGVMSWMTLTERIPSSGIELRWAMLGFLAVMALLTWMRRGQAAEEEQRD